MDTLFTDFDRGGELGRQGMVCFPGSGERDGLQIGFGTAVVFIAVASRKDRKEGSKGGNEIEMFFHGIQCFGFLRKV